MDTNSIIAALDAEIERLNRARALLLEDGNKVSSSNTELPPKTRREAKRVLRPAARKRIAAAQRKRWAAIKKQKKAATITVRANAAKRPGATKKADRANPRKGSSKRLAQIKVKKASQKRAPRVHARRSVPKNGVPAKAEALRTEALPS
jgi:hypothetical protein